MLILDVITTESRQRLEENALDRLWMALPDEGRGLSHEERMLLHSAVAALSEQERQIVLLYAVTGWKHREIAALLQMPLPTVLSKYHRALKKLKTHWKGEDAL